MGARNWAFSPKNDPQMAPAIRLMKTFAAKLSLSASTMLPPYNVGV
ncbi:hypothetical protein [Methanothrix sp.]